MTTIEHFMALLAAGLNQTEYRIDTLPAVEEWDPLYKYSLQQNLLPIISEQLVFSGVYELAGKAISGKDAKEQKEAFAATCRKRGSEAAIPSFDEVLESIEASPEMLDAWENYRKNNPYVEDLTWGEAIHSVKLLKDQID